MDKIMFDKIINDYKEYYNLNYKMTITTIDCLALNDDDFYFLNEDWYLKAIKKGTCGEERVVYIPYENISNIQVYPLNYAN